MKYNATILELDDKDNIISVFVGAVDREGRILRSNAIQCTGLEDTLEYDSYIRSQCSERLEVIVDDCRAYLAVMTGLDLPAGWWHD